MEDSVTVATEPEGLSLSDKIQMYEDSEQASRDARELAERCRDYYDNKQLTTEELTELRKRGQPEVIRNKIRRKVNFLLGFENQTRTDPKAFPRNDADDDTAASATDALRFQEEAGQLDSKFSDVWENLVIEGFGGVEVLGQDPKDERKIEVRRWRWDRLFYDPHSSEHDFTDATYMGGFIWMDEKAALAKWPDAAGAITNTVGGENTKFGRTYDDKPKETLWCSVNGKRKRVRIVQMYYLDGEQWMWCLFTKGGEISGGPVEFLDQHGKSECPLYLQSAYIDRENNRYGEVSELLSTQDALNKAGSKSLHLMSSTLTVGEQGAVLDVDKMKGEKARPDGHVELAPGAMTNKRFEFVRHDAEIRGHMELMDRAEAHIDQAGPNAALTGTQGGAPSGRAIRANQEGGIIELSRLKDRHIGFKERVYKALWSRIRQFWTEEIWVRVTDNDEDVRFVGFNRPQTMAEKMIEDAKKEGIPEDEIYGQLEQAGQDPMMRQQLEQVVGMVNVPAEIDVDIQIEAATESVNMAEENFQSFMQAFPPGSVPIEVVLELWPGSPRVKRRIRQMIKPDPMMAQKAEMADGMKADNLQADTDQKRAKAAKDAAAAHVSLVPPMPEQLPIPAETQQFVQQ